MIAQLVEGPDNLEQRFSCTFPDALIIMRQKRDKLKSTLFDIRKEMALSSREEGSNSVGGNFLLDSNGAVNIH